MKLYEKFLLKLQTVGISSLELRFLIVGGINTLIGYLTVTCIYTMLKDKVSFFMIGVISNIIAISITFTLQKLLVFQTRGNWLKEYLRSYITYGFVGVLGYVMLWVFLNIFRINVWISQGLIMLVITAISFFGHKKITFGLKK